MSPAPRKMLASPEFEADVLGGLMIASVQGSPMVDEVAGIVDLDSFTVETHRLIWGAIVDLAKVGKPHDATAVSKRLEEVGGLDSRSGFAEIHNIVADTPGTAILIRRAEALREYANRRTLYAACREAMEEIYRSDVADVIGGISGKLDSILSAGVAEADSFSRVISITEARVQQAIDDRRNGRAMGVPFGLPALDLLTSGMQSGELWGIAARTSIGKTALANQVAIHAAGQGHAGLIMSLEEPHEGIGMRAIANRGGISLSSMRSGLANLDEVTDAAIRADLRSLPLWVDNKTFDLRRIVARITQYRRKHKIAFAVVDHIGLVRIQGTSGQRRYELLGEVTRSLKHLAMQLEIPIVVLIQIGRDSEKEARRPMLSDLRESGNVEQDINGCVALHPKGLPDPRTGAVPLEVGLIKNRYGARCWLDAQFEFHGSVQQLRQVGLEE